MKTEEKSFGDRETLRSGKEPGEEARSFGERETLRSGEWGLLEAWEGKRWKEGEEILGRYVVERELGQGGMGVVYGCFDKVGGVRVAVKALPPELSHNSVEMEEVRENFELVYHLSHPHIAGVKTLERDGKGEFFLVMELAEGEPLRRWMRRKFQSGKSEGGSGGRGLPLTEVLPVLRQMAAALDYAHSKKVVHRDVKPGNVVIDGKGDVKVLDFGLAAQIRTSLSRASQAYRGTSGTGPYMAPEQWEGQPQGGAADQYALAVMAYEMLAGRLPFENSEPAVLREAVLKGEARTIPGLPKAAMAALRRGMAKNPAGRFGSCGEFTAALADDKDSRGGRHPPSPGSRFRPWVLLGGGVLISVLAGILFWMGGLFDRQAGAAFARCRQELEQTRARAVQFSGDDAHLGRAFAAHREDLQAELLRGESAMGDYDLHAAQAAFRKARQAADWLEKQQNPALSAVEARKAAEKAADQAREAGADRFAEKTFREAATGGEKALLAFDRGDFAAAQRQWKEADRTFRRAEKEARQWRRDDLEKRVQRVRERTKVHRAVDLGKTFRDKATALEEALQRAETVLVGDEFDHAESVLFEATAAAEWLEKHSVAGGKAVAARSKAQTAKERAEQADAGRLAARACDKGAQCAGNAATAFEDARFEDAQREWEDAEAAFRNAAEQARETQKRNRESKVEQALAAVRRAKREEAWEEVASAAGKVLELEAGNGEATQLQVEAEKQLKPRLAVSAVWPDRTPATGATLRVGSTTTPLPHSFDCSATPVFGPGEAILEKGGKTHVGSLERMEVDWKGEKAIAVALKERKPETAARPKPRPRLPQKAGARGTVQVGAQKVSLRWCPAASPQMGSAGGETGKSTNGTPYPMTLAQGFWMGETEVTQGLWKEVTGENPSFFKTGDNYPVENVSWEDCQMFVQALNAKHGQAGFLWALPTEAQWEHACRAGTDTVYCWGNAPDRDKANYGGRRGTGMKGPHSPGTKPVGSYATNAWGLHDMHGNVWEWCGDGNGPHLGGAVTNPAEASPGPRHVYRGGSWLFDERDCRSASRAVGGWGYHYSDLGLRLALVPEP